MKPTDTAFPTPAEIEAHILAARKLRAETISDLVTAALRWLTQPRFGHRTA